ncbi:rhodanese-like domain-containing protein [Candidatus Woesearchaeota archaeon]|nr:rhodanese-like domain-containing protein [Candidatus Woesearchaeota archaeon]
MKQFLQKLFGKETTCATGTCTTAAPKEENRTLDLSPEDFSKELKKQDIILIDVRRPEEFNEGHIKNAKLLPVQELSEEKMDELGVKKNDDILLYCRSGGRSGHALHMLQAAGYNHVRHLDGGILAWQEKKLPLEK